MYEALTWPDVQTLQSSNPQTTAFIERYRHEQGAEPQFDPVPYAEISDELKAAVLVAEDIDFFSHNGFALDELEKAIRETIKEGKKLRGASTITQQLAKNLWLEPSRNPLRKVREALLTRQLERHLDKRRILELYLNVVEFGPGIYGAEAAARAYFSRGADRLTTAQAAALAASLSRPSRWHPGVESRGYQNRIRLIRQRMAQSAWVRGSL